MRPTSANTADTAYWRTIDAINAISQCELFQYSSPSSLAHKGYRAHEHDGDHIGGYFYLVLSAELARILGVIKKAKAVRLAAEKKAIRLEARARYYSSKA